MNVIDTKTKQVLIAKGIVGSSVHIDMFDWRTNAHVELNFSEDEVHRILNAIYDVMEE